MLAAPGVELAARLVRVVDEAAGWATGTDPGFGAVLAVLPVGDVLAAVGEGGEGAVVGELGGEGGACGELKELAVGRGCEVAAAVTLLPPDVLFQLVEGVDDEVGVLVVLVGVVSALCCLVRL